MNCREFEQSWDDLFDARWEAPAHLERWLEEHASACPKCRPVSDRNQLLRQAMAGLRAPTPSPGSIERLHALVVPSGRPSIAIGTAPPPTPPRRLRKPLATAAAFALAWLGGNCWPSREPVEVLPPTPMLTASPRPPLGLTLAGAAEATLDLARKTSEPASRFSREFLELGLPPDSTAAGSLPIDIDADADADSADSNATSGLIRAVGAGVKPISGSAQHAFRFLRGLADGAALPPSPGPRRDSL